MQVSFNPLEPREAAAVRILLGLPLDVPTASQPAPVALLAAAPLATDAQPLLAAAPLATDAQPLPAASAAPKSHKKRMAAAPAPEASTAAAPGVAVPSATLSIGDMLANSTQPATLSTGALPTVSENVPAPHVPVTPAPITGPTAAAQQAAAGAKPPTVEDVRAAYRDLFAVVGEEPGKAELRAVLAKAGAATVSDLKPDAYAATVRSLNAATILAKSKTAPAQPAGKDPLL